MFPADNPTFNEVTELEKRRHEYEERVLAAAKQRAEALRLKKIAERTNNLLMSANSDKPVNQRAILADCDPKYIEAEKKATEAEYKAILLQAELDATTNHIKTLCMIASCLKNERNFQ